MKIILSLSIALSLGAYYYLNQTNIIDKGDIETKKLTIGFPILRIALPVIVAQKNGYFKQEGLDVELKSYVTAQPMMDALVSGKIDMGGFCALPITFSAMARSKTELLFLGGMYENDEHPISVMLIKEDDTEIKTIKDLKGKKIGILPTRAYEVWLQDILVSNGVDLQDVIIKQISPKLQADALKKRSVDAIFTNDPASTMVVQKGVGKKLTNNALVPEATGFSEFYFGSFNIRKDFADKNPQIVNKIAIALDKANSFISDNQDDARLMLKDYFPEVFHKIIKYFPKSYFKQSNEVSDVDLGKMKNFYLKKHMLPVNINLDGMQYGY